MKAIQTRKRPDYGEVNALINVANKTARRYNREVSNALVTYGGHGPLISGVERDHFPPAVKVRLRALIQRFHEEQDAIGEAWRKVHPRTGFYCSLRAAPFRAAMVRAGRYGTGDLLE